MSSSNIELITLGIAVAVTYGAATKHVASHIASFFSKRARHD